MILRYVALSSRAVIPRLDRGTHVDNLTNIQQVLRMGPAVKPRDDTGEGWGEGFHTMERGSHTVRFKR